VRLILIQIGVSCSAVCFRDQVQRSGAFFQRFVVIEGRVLEVERRRNRESRANMSAGRLTLSALQNEC
jgi:hypothetical protein